MKMLVLFGSCFFAGMFMASKYKTPLTFGEMVSGTVFLSIIVLNALYVFLVVIQEMYSGFDGALDSFESVMNLTILGVAFFAAGIWFSLGLSGYSQAGFQAFVAIGIPIGFGAFLGVLFGLIVAMGISYALDQIFKGKRMRCSRGLNGK